ncbi:MAG: archaeosortase A [Thermoplasmatales archaeon]|nr:archaeosortase A [Thermoplasmatales archaeon]
MIEPLNIILFTGLILLGIGYFVKRKEGKIFNITGYILFGFYWVFQAPYFLKIADLVNAVFCMLALPFFLYMAYHDFVSFRKNEDIGCLRFLAGWVFFAGFVYFLIEKTSSLEYGLRYEAAYETVLLLNLLGINATQNGIWLHWSDADAGIILACTAIQSIMIFLGAFIAVKANLKRKIYAFLATCPVIWFLNLIRNASLMVIVGTTGIDMEFAHNYIGKTGSLITLIVLAWVVFRILPELYDNIVGLMELYKRKTT